MTETDEVIDAARAGRIRRQGGPIAPTQRRPRRGRGGLKTRVVAIAAVNAAILLLASLVGGIFFPLGMFGALAVMLMMIAATLAIALAPAMPVPTPERIARADLKALPAQAFPAVAHAALIRTDTPEPVKRLRLTWAVLRGRV